MKPLKALPRAPTKAAIIAIAGAFAVIAGYTLLAAFPFLEGPSLTIAPMQENTGTTMVSGKTSRVSYLSINGLPVALNEDGSFLVERAFPAGYTAVTVAATDRFGRTLTKALTFVTTYHGEK
jgi:hypothetical protein